MKLRRPLALATGASAGAMIVAMGVCGCANAETLSDALALAYQSNPTLQQARAQQRALDETSVQARANLRPTVTASATDDYEKTYGAFGQSVNSGGATLSITQPIFTSGKITAAIRSADASVYAGRETLRATEISVLLSVIQSYEDVLRDQTALKIRQDDVDALHTVMDEIGARREVGTITRTDVLQIQTQLDTARSTLSAAQAQLQNSRAAYAAVVGQNPGELAPPLTLPGLPKDVDSAFDIAEADNPLLSAARLTETASRERIAEARAGFGPSVAVGAQYGYSGNTTPAQTVDYSRAFTAQVTITQPLLTGGLTRSLTRQAIELNAADRVGIEKTRRQVVEGVAQAWNQLISSQNMESSDASARDAAKLELEGMREEYKAGLRTTLEVLSADQTARAAELNWAIARHDGFMASASLLGAMGRLDADKILEGQQLYDPERHFEKVKTKGAIVYEPLISALDGVVSPRSIQVKPVEAPPPAANPPVLQPAAPLPLATSPLVQASPITALAIRPEPAPRNVTLAVQIAAVPTTNLADSAWADVDRAMPGRMAEKKRVLEPIDVKGQTLFRVLVTGFVDKAAAQSFCSELKAKHKDCLVRRVAAAVGHVGRSDV